MKKILTILATFSLLLLVACGTNTQTNDQQTSNVQPEEVPTVPVVDQTVPESSVTNSNNLITIGKGGRLDILELTVNAGTTVTWKNEAGTKLPLIGDKADKFSTTLDVDSTYSHTYETPGTYVYNYGVSSGKVIVE